MTAVEQVPQHMQALAKGQKIRLQRAAVKVAVGNGDLSADKLVLDPPECCLTMPVIDLLTAQHRWGRARALGLLRPLGIAEGRELGQLTERQRMELFVRMGGRS